MAGPSGRLKRLLADLGERKLTELLFEALHLLRLSASYVPFDAADTSRTEQSSVCVPGLQLWQRRRDVLHCREAHRLTELNIMICFFLKKKINFCHNVYT